ncbi:MaoC/PaaZ C-terminal domain-containing protein [Streptomyces sp. V4-01]|uniref:MaoC/PaaZ C-terminal domain-containing protein n=1 Tax=Actinacidiphila polyblastidii TaxID=3110430 RepID=A0ABU7PKG4_9ACTN|nr:MaoC/PaaZ C-terminal domain-containing protein [Streptomyces sp. V4-01]
MTGLYLEEFAPGQQWTSPGRTITETDVVNFAGLSGDYNPIHTDAEFCRGTPYGRRVVYGVLGMSVLTGLLDRIGVFIGTAVAMVKLTDWRFLAPVFIGDTVTFRMTVKTVRQTTDGSPGPVAVTCALLNQDGRTVQQGVMVVLVRSDRSSAASDRPPSTTCATPSAEAGAGLIGAR